LSILWSGGLLVLSSFQQYEEKNCHFMCLSFGAITLLEQRYDSIFFVL
jgi:hypothetical protein